MRLAYFAVFRLFNSATRIYSRLFQLFRQGVSLFRALIVRYGGGRFLPSRYRLFEPVVYRELFAIADRNAAVQHSVMKRLRLLAICLLSLVSVLPASAVDRAEEVRATEVAFAKAFADRDVKKFFSFLADDAQFLGRRKTMHGKQEVIATWSEFFKPAVAPFRWQPERVVTNAAGDLGFSSGPVFDQGGAQIGTFTSTWVRQPDGSWKILFDGGSACPMAKQSEE